jgi:hypothetical protein
LILLCRSGPPLKSSTSPHIHFDTTTILNMSVSSPLKDAIRRSAVDEVEAILLKHPDAARQDDLDTCLGLAMPHASLEMIKRLLQLGADFEPLTISNAVQRAEAAVFELMVAFGWDVNSTRFERAAIQYVQLVDFNHPVS